MNDEYDVGLGDFNFPSSEIEIPNAENQVAKPVVDPQTYSDIEVDAASNQMLVEGVAELKDHPQLEPFLSHLNDLKNKFVSEVEDASKKFELKGSVKVLFAIKRKD